MVTEAELRTKFRGTLLGGAVGDALGSPIEDISFGLIDAIGAERYLEHPHS